MSVRLIVGPKCTLAALHVVSHGEYANGTERQTDGWTSYRYITLTARRGQHNKRVA